MKKLLLFIAFALLLPLFSCTSDEAETQSKTGVDKNINPPKETRADGPGDGGKTPPPPMDK